MTTSNERRRRLSRLHDVQSQLRQIEEWRLARLAGQIRDLADEAREVFEVLNEDKALGGLFVDVRARRLRSIAEQTARATEAHARQTHRVIERTRREKGAERLSDAAAREEAEAVAKDDLETAIERSLSTAPQAPDKFGT